MAREHIQIAAIDSNTAVTADTNFASFSISKATRIRISACITEAGTPQLQIRNGSGLLVNLGQLPQSSLTTFEIDLMAGDHIFRCPSAITLRHFVVTEAMA